VNYEKLFDFKLPTEDQNINDSKASKSRLASYYMQFSSNDDFLLLQYSEFQEEQTRVNQHEPGLIYILDIKKQELSRTFSQLNVPFRTDHRF